MLSTYVSYQLVTKNVQGSLDGVAKTPVAAREIAYWNENLSKVKTVDAFLADTRLFNFAMKAHGLSDLSFAKGLMRKVLTDGVSSPGALANRLADPRYKDFAKAFDFARLGPFTTGMPDLKTGTVEKYLRQSIEENAGQTNEGVRLALYFQRKAPGVQNAMGILADRALLRVVQTAFNMPASMSMANIDAQAAAIEAKLDIASLRTEDGMNKFLKRFTALWDIGQQAARPSVGLPGQAAGASGLVSVDTLMSIARMRVGG